MVRAEDFQLPNSMVPGCGRFHLHSQEELESTVSAAPPMVHGSVKHLPGMLPNRIFYLFTQLLGHLRPSYVTVHSGI